MDEMVTDPQGILDLVRRAQEERRVLHIVYEARYTGQPEITERDIEVVDQDGYYCHAHCRLRDDRRTFIIDRIQAAQLKDETFGLTQAQIVSLLIQAATPFPNRPERKPRKVKPIESVKPRPQLPDVAQAGPEVGSKTGCAAIVALAFGHGAGDCSLDPRDPVEDRPRRRNSPF